MGTKISENTGSILLESVIALLILCLTVASVMLLTGIIVKGHITTEASYEEAFALNSLRDQIADRITQLSDSDPAAIVSAIGSVIVSKKGWRFRILSDEKGLIDLLLIYDTLEEKHEYRIKIYKDP